MNTLELYQNNSLEDWKQLLQPIGYHYHHGFPGESDNIFKNSLYSNVYPFIPNNTSVLDCGCGWGGTLKMLQEDKQCDVIGVTNNDQQFNFIKNNVIKADLNYYFPNRSFDTALLVESFSHIKNQNLLLKHLSLTCKNIVLITHLSRLSSPVFDEEWLMYCNTIPNMLKQLDSVGYKLKYFKDLGTDHIIPSFKYWKSKLDIIKPSNGQLALLVKLCEQDPVEFAKISGLFLIHAETSL